METDIQPLFNIVNEQNAPVDIDSPINDIILSIPIFCRTLSITAIFWVDFHGHLFDSRNLNIHKSSTENFVAASWELVTTRPPRLSRPFWCSQICRPPEKSGQIFRGKKTSKNCPPTTTPKKRFFTHCFCKGWPGILGDDFCWDLEKIAFFAIFWCQDLPAPHSWSGVAPLRSIGSKGYFKRDPKNPTRTCCL